MTATIPLSKRLANIAADDERPTHLDVLECASVAAALEAQRDRLLAACKAAREAYRYVGNAEAVAMLEAAIADAESEGGR